MVRNLVDVEENDKPAPDYTLDLMHLPLNVGSWSLGDQLLLHVTIGDSKVESV